MPPTMIHRPGSPSGMRISPTTSAPTSAIRASAVTYPLLDWGLHGVQFLLQRYPKDLSTDDSRRFHHARTDRRSAATRIRQRFRRRAGFRVDPSHGSGHHGSARQD